MGLLPRLNRQSQIPDVSREVVIVPEHAFPEVSTISAETSTESWYSFSFTSSNTDTPSVHESFPTLVVLNVSNFVSDTFARIHWSTRGGSDSELFVAIMNDRGGVWQISEAVNTSKGFHLIEGLSPGTVYKVRLLASRRVDDFSIFEDVFKTRKGEKLQQVNSNGG
ncbi:neuronal cell adhesion molecule-like [Paramisgurnus dabryanus]|uniref:neuronal cell adhesion molecule-like n=1 Tax=Paramisgurnus dabryanus TaxID=90735 RepID=UPI003CCF75D5